MPPVASLKKTYAAHPSVTATTSYLTAMDDVEMLDVPTMGWAIVEAKFQELRALLSAPTTGLNASQAREEQKRVVTAAITRLLDRAQAECRRLLISGNAKAAVEGGLKTLKLKEEFYGPGSLQLVPAYFHLARTNQFMDKFKRAEEFLSLAQYEVLRHPEADISLSAELHQTFGLLYASDGKLDAALKQLTSATYYLSCMHGPEHVLTSFGYFDLGNVFAAKSHMENAMAFYEKVKKIWETFLGDQLNKMLASDTSYQSPEALGEENVQDAVKMLRGIVGLQSERYGVIHPSPAMAEQVLGMFLLWSGDATGAFEALLRALEIFKRVLGERHPKCQGVRVLLVHHGFQVPEDTSDVLSADETHAAALATAAAEHNGRVASSASDNRAGSRTSQPAEVTKAAAPSETHATPAAQTTAEPALKTPTPPPGPPPARKTPTTPPSAPPQPPAEADGAGATEDKAAAAPTHSSAIQEEQHQEAALAAHAPPPPHDEVQHAEPPSSSSAAVAPHHHTEQQAGESVEHHAPAQPSEHGAVAGSEVHTSGATQEAAHHNDGAATSSLHEEGGATHTEPVVAPAAPEATHEHATAASDAAHHDEAAPVSEQPPAA